jgi:hypothetical protein
MFTDEDRERIRHPPGGGVRTIGLKPRDPAATASAKPGTSTSDGGATLAAGAPGSASIAGAASVAAAEAGGAVRHANRPGTRRRAKWKRAALRKTAREADDTGTAVHGPGDVQHVSNLPSPSPKPESATDAASTVPAGAEHEPSHDVSMDSEPAATDNAGQPDGSTDASDHAPDVPSNPEPAAAVSLIHDDDFSPCVCPGLYCARGTHPYCSVCHRTSYEEPCCHLREFADELDFDC